MKNRPIFRALRCKFSAERYTLVSSCVLINVGPHIFYFTNWRPIILSSTRCLKVFKLQGTVHFFFESRLRCTHTHTDTSLARNESREKLFLLLLNEYNIVRDVFRGSSSILFLSIIHPVIYIQTEKTNACM